ncbi:hypothetical protein KY343_03650 [Candidatus Woesearchaeota archaeon]|nr:hypothetical protein [Candidatus Woesearchaeota archaeon]
MPYKDLKKKKEWERKYRRKNRAKLNKKVNEWKKNNPEKLKEMREREYKKRKEKYRANPEKWRKYWRKYNIEYSKKNKEKIYKRKKALMDKYLKESKCIICGKKIDTHIPYVKEKKQFKNMKKLGFKFDVYCKRCREAKRKSNNKTKKKIIEKRGRRKDES